MIIIGLTGSIGMGKTTTAKLFEAQGVQVADSDAIVHELYQGKAVPLIEAAFPGAVIEGTVDRAQLSATVLGKPDALQKLENIIHPLVRQAQDAFLKGAKAGGARFALLDIPLLFETKSESRVDKIIATTAPAHIQRQRVLARPGMTANKLNAILARQMPDAEKQKRADFVIDTSLGLIAAQQAILKILAELSKTA